MVSLLAFGLFPGCGEATTARDANALHGDFITALKARHWSGPGGFETCVLGPKTIVYGDDRDEAEPGRWETFRGRLPAIRRDTYDSFWAENGKPRAIAPKGGSPMSVHVLTEAECSALAAIDEYWDAFHRRYANAVRVDLTAPGFSDDNRQALLYYEASFGVLAAWGSYCLLVPDGDHWKIAEEFCVWQS